MPPEGAFGYDISFPQCPNRVPEGPVGFGIIGVNNGRPMTQNPCFAAQVQWARGGTTAPGVYINSSSPPSTFTAAACGADDRLCRAFEFGKQSAQHAMAYVNQHGAVSDYWLDVETANQWSADTTENAAVLRGMVSVLTAAGKYIGIYSNNYQFTRIAGSYAPGLDNWIPRPEAKRDTVQNYCRNTPSFGGGRIVMIQMWYTFDENYVCRAAGSVPAPTPVNLKPGDTAIVSADGSCLNLRSGASLTSSIVRCVPEGTRVTVTGAAVTSGAYQWVPVTSGSSSGWMAGEYLRLAPAGSPSATPTASPSPTPKPKQHRIVVGNLAGG